MERLTYRDEEGKARVVGMNENNTASKLIEAVQKLAEYEDAEESKTTELRR